MNIHLKISQTFVENKSKIAEKLPAVETANSSEKEVPQHFSYTN